MVPRRHFYTTDFPPEDISRPEGEKSLLDHPRLTQLRPGLGHDHDQHAEHDHRQEPPCPVERETAGAELVGEIADRHAGNEEEQEGDARRRRAE